MATEFMLKESKDGCRVFSRHLVSHGEYRSRYNHLTNECKFTPEEAASELYLMVGKFTERTEAPAPRAICEDYIFTYIDPGDILIIDGQYFVVNAP